MIRASRSCCGPSVLVEPAFEVGGSKLSGQHIKKGGLLTQTPFFNMARFEGETSNRLLETLEEWNEFLKKYAPYFKEVA